MKVMMWLAETNNKTSQTNSGWWKKELLQYNASRHYKIGIGMSKKDRSIRELIALSAHSCNDPKKGALL